LGTKRKQILTLNAALKILFSNPPKRRKTTEKKNGRAEKSKAVDTNEESEHEKFAVLDDVQGDPLFHLS